MGSMAVVPNRSFHRYTVYLPERELLFIKAKAESEGYSISKLTKEVMYAYAETNLSTEGLQSILKGHKLVERTVHKT